MHSLFAESESFVLLSFYVQKTTGAAVHGATGGAMGRGTGRGMKTARERVERKPRVRRANENRFLERARVFVLLLLLMLMLLLILV